MSMRYIIRRPNRQDLEEVRQHFPDLESQLGSAQVDLRRDLRVVFSPMQRVTYLFSAEEVNGAWTWVCPTVELVGESQKDLLELTNRYNIPGESLSHLSSKQSTEQIIR